MPPKLFISYAHKDGGKFAQALAKALRGEGYAVWVDSDCIPKGGRWSDVIDDALENAELVVALVTPNASRRADSYALHECIKSLAKSKQLLTIHVRKTCRPAIFLSELQLIDATFWRPGAGCANFAQIVIGHLNSTQVAGLQSSADLAARLHPIPCVREMEILLRAFHGRDWLLAEVDEWLRDPYGQRIFLLLGPPGIGKSAVAARLAVERSHYVKAFHVCRRDDSRTREPLQVLPSIAFQLADQLPWYREMLEDLGTSGELSRILSLDPAPVFTELIADRLCEHREDDSVVIVIDGLDEAQEGGTCELATILRNRLDRLPPWVRVLVTSRPNEPCVDALRAFEPRVLDATDHRNLNDLEEYVKAELRKKFPTASDAEIEDASGEVATRSEGIFLYPASALPALASPKDTTTLPIDMAAAHSDDMERRFKGLSYDEQIAPVLSLIAAACRPMPPEFHRAVLGWKDGQIKPFCSVAPPLFSVDSAEGIQPYHRSLLEWLCGRNSREFGIDPQEGHSKLADYGLTVWAGPSPHRDYFLRHLPTHLMAAETFDEARDLLCRLEYVQAKCELEGVDALMDDCNQLHISSPSSANHPGFAEMRRFLSARSHILRMAPELVIQEAYAQTASTTVHEQAAALVSSGTARGVVERFSAPDELPVASMILVGHGAWVFCCEWSSDGKRIASGSEDETCRIWDAATGQQVHCLKPCGEDSERCTRGGEVAQGRSRSRGVASLAWSPDGSRLVTGSWDGRLLLWDTHTGHLIRQLAMLPDAVRACSWHPREAQVAVACDDHTVAVYDVETADRRIAVLFGHEDAVRCCSWSRDGSRLASCSNDRTIRIWVLEAPMVPRVLTGHEAQVTCCRWSTDGTRLLSSSNDGTARVWQVATGETLVALKGHSGRVNSCAWTEGIEGAVSASSDRTLMLWDAFEGRRIATLHGHSGTVLACSWTHGARRVVSGSCDGTLMVWDLGDVIAHRSEVSHRARVVGCCWQENCAITADRTGGALLWPVGDGAAAIQPTAHRLICSPDGEMPHATPDATPVLLSLSPSGAHALVERPGCDVTVVSTGDGSEVAPLRVDGAPATAWAWSHGGDTLAVVVADGQFFVVDLEKGDSHTGAIGCERCPTAVAISAGNGELAVGCVDGSLWVRPLGEGAAHALTPAHNCAISACAWAPDGDFLAAGGKSGQVAVWRADGVGEPHCWDAHRGEVTVCEWRSRPRSLLSAGHDGMVAVWAPPDWERLALVSTAAPVSCVAFATGGRLLVAGDDSGRAYLFRLPEG